MIGESCTIHLKVAPTISHPPQVQDHDVPILVDDKEKVLEYPWDLTTQQVIPTLVIGVLHSKTKISQHYRNGSVYCYRRMMRSNSLRIY